MSIFDLVDKIDETSCCDRFFGWVIVTGYLYRFGTWLMHFFMVQVDVWYMLAQVIGQFVIVCLV